MNITVNGRDTEVNEGITISELLRQKGLNPQAVIIERNYEIVDKEKWENTVIMQGDHVEILSFVGGG